MLHDCGNGRVFWGEWDSAAAASADNNIINKSNIGIGAILCMAERSWEHKNEARLRRIAAAVFLDPIEEMMTGSCFETTLRPKATDEQRVIEDAVRRAKFIAGTGRNLTTLVISHGDGGALAAAAVAAYFVLECGTSPPNAVDYFRNMLPANCGVPDEAFLITVQGQRNSGRRKTITNILGGGGGGGSSRH